MLANPGARPSESVAPRVCLEVSSSCDVLRLVDHVSEQFAHLAGLDDDASHGLNLAVREAVVNAMKHGNGGDARKQVRLEFSIVRDPAPARVCVRVEDEGTGFDLHTVADPLAPESLERHCGRGVLIMRAFMDDVRVHRVPGGGTEVSMFKVVTPPSTKS